MKKFVLICAILLISILAFANQALKQQIIDFEQAIPWSDVYARFEQRQPSWQDDVRAATTPQELGKLLVELQNFIVKERLGYSWETVKDQWIAKTLNAKSYKEVAESLKQLQDYYFGKVRDASTDIKREIINFEQYVPWSDVKEGFKERQIMWQYEVKNARSPQQLGKLLLELHNWIYPEKFANEWTVKKTQWINNVQKVKSWDELRSLLRELEWNYRKGK